MFTNDAKQRAKAAKAKAWADFKMKYPNADLSRFEAQVNFDNQSVSSEIYFK